MTILYFASSELARRPGRDSSHPHRIGYHHHPLFLWNCQFPFVSLSPANHGDRHFMSPPSIPGRIHEIAVEAPPATLPYIVLAFQYHFVFLFINQRYCCLGSVGKGAVLAEEQAGWTDASPTLHGSSTTPPPGRLPVDFEAGSTVRVTIIARRQSSNL
jgi:hypothetical protein